MWNKNKTPQEKEKQYPSEKELQNLSEQNRQLESLPVKNA